MVRQRIVQNVVNHRVERKTHNAVRLNCLEKHFYVATRVERNQSSKHWILTLGKEGPQQPLIQRLDFAQAKRECKRLHDEHLARTQEECRTIPGSQQVKQRKGQLIEDIEEYDYAVDPKQDGVSTKGRGETCRELRQVRGVRCRQLRHRRRIGTENIGRRAIGILSILQALTICVFSQPPDNRWTVWAVHPQIQHVQSLHSMITFHHANTRGSRAGRLRIAHLCVPDTQDQWSSTHIYPAMFHGRVPDQHKSHLSRCLCV